jgi:hypothetical protein
VSRGRRLSLRRRDQERQARRRRWLLVLVVGSGVLAAYYGMVLVNMRGHDASAVALDEGRLTHPRDRVTLEIQAADLDTSAGSFGFQMRPVPHGVLEGTDAGELAAPLEVRVSSAGQPPQTFAFAANQLIDPVAVTVGSTTGANGFPFDRPRMDFRLAVLSHGDAVASDLDMTDQTEGWNLSGTARRTAASPGDLQVAMRASRETLAVSFALFYIAGIVVVALITVAVIGGAVARRQVGFDQVIWLGAMLVAVPAVRNEMPGVPPIGTAIDLFVFFPSIVIVGVALLAAVVVLVINEAAANAPPAVPSSAAGDED